MTLSTRLKASAVLFAVLWTVGMLIWSGSQDPVAFVVWTLGGALAGYLWYLGMRWLVRRLPARGEQA